MKKLSSLLLLFFVSMSVFAQIEEEIRNYKDTNNILIKNGRSMILDHVLNKNYDKVAEVYDFLNKLTLSGHYSAFNYSENLFINLLIGDWKAATYRMKNYSFYIKQSVYPYSIDKEFSYILISNVKNERESLLSEIAVADLDTESKTVLQLLVKFFSIKKSDEDIHAQLREFNKTYNQNKENPSVYNDFIDNYLPKPMPEGHLAFSAGSGVIVGAEKFGKQFNPAACFNFSLDFRYEKFFGSLYGVGTNYRLKDSLLLLNHNGLVLNNDEKLAFFNGGFKGGYILLDSKFVKIAPYASISGSSLQTDWYKDKDDGDEFKLFNSFTYGVGLHTSIKIKEFKQQNNYGYYYGGYPMKSFVALKLDAAYNNLVKSKVAEVKGNTAIFTVALVWGMGGF